MSKVDHSVPVTRFARRCAPLLVVTAILLVVWLFASTAMNWSRVSATVLSDGTAAPWASIVSQAWALERPLLPAPQQVAIELWNSVTGAPIDSRRNLLFHVGVTLGSALLGLAGGTLLGLLLALLVVESRMFDEAAMPWIVASQALPTLAIAPIVVVLMGRMGLAETWQKIVIGAVVVFFPITLGAVKGLRSAAPELHDLLHTYAASRWRSLLVLRVPSAVPFFFPALKVAASLSVVASIVAELPTGAQSGLGARLLVASYNGLILSMWGSLVASALLAALAVAGVGLLERAVVRTNGERS